MRNLIIAIALLMGTATLSAQNSKPMQKMNKTIVVKDDVKPIDTAIVIGRKGNSKLYYIDGYSSCGDYMRDVQNGGAKLPEGWSLKTTTCSEANGEIYIERNPYQAIKVDKKDN